MPKNIPFGGFAFHITSPGFGALSYPTYQIRDLYISYSFYLYYHCFIIMSNIILKKGKGIICNAANFSTIYPKNS